MALFFFQSGLCISNVLPYAFTYILNNSEACEFILCLLKVLHDCCIYPFSFFQFFLNGKSGEFGLLALLDFLCLIISIFKRNLYFLCQEIVQMNPGPRWIRYPILSIYSSVSFFKLQHTGILVNLSVKSRTHVAGIAGY